MRTVEATRTVPAAAEEVAAALTPETIILHEGTFTVADIEQTDRGTVVTATATGISATFRFEPLQSGYYYEQEGSEGPFESMATTLSYRRVTAGTELTMTSDVSLGIRPRVVFDRVGAWKRRGELKRALRSLASEFE